MKYFNKYYWIRKIFINKFISLFISKNSLNKIVFNSIYKSNHWNKSSKFEPNNQSYSGPGSIPNSIQTNSLIIQLEKFFKEKNIRKVLDAPCGDCAWIKKIFTTEIEYTGVDIVEDLINKNINFYCRDMTEFDEFHDYDFILLRDFFIHLPIKKIKKILINLKKSNCKYFAFNSYENTENNKEILTGQHRKINLLKDPFNLSRPYFKVLEIKNDNFPDKKDKDNYIYIYKN